MTLRQFIRDPKTGRNKHGSLSRISEHLDVRKSTVLRWVNGDWKPSAEMQERIDSMISSGLDLAPRNKGRSGVKAVHDKIEVKCACGWEAKRTERHNEKAPCPRCGAMLIQATA